MDTEMENGLWVRGDGKKRRRHGLCRRVETLKTHKYVGGREQREYVLGGNQKRHVHVTILALPRLPVSSCQLPLTIRFTKLFECYVF